jgi:hypothetical protein
MHCSLFFIFYCLAGLSRLFVYFILFFIFMVASNGCTHAVPPLRWACGLGLGGMVGSALFDDFIFH